MGYRDDMEAARQRVAVLERELRDLVPRGDGISIELELVELRRSLARAEEQLEAERERREEAEMAVQELALARERIASLEQSLEMVQSELQRRRREYESIWRKAALAEVRGREADELRVALREATASSTREARRADVAEIALIRTQMRLAVERARSSVAEPWPLDAARTRRRELSRAYAPAALGALPRERLERLLARLTLLCADLSWNPPSSRHAELFELFEVLRAAGHPLADRDTVHRGPHPGEAPGLGIAIAPLALQLSWTRDDRSAVVVTLADDRPLSAAHRAPP